MRNVARKVVHCTLLLTVLMIGCSKPGSEFVGKWVNATNSTDSWTISRNGDNFLVTGPDNQSIGATYNNGTLSVPGVMGSALTFTYVKDTDSLLAPGLFGQVTYKRAK